MTEMDFNKIEQKWQKKWEEKKAFVVKEESKKKKYYVLEMFPYPSGSGLHMGHALNYTIGDIYSRFKRMNGFNVLYPMGFDALGLPAENAAILSKTHPSEYTKNSIKNFIFQQKSLGLSYDWNRVINTSEPEYYKWDQWIFLKMFEKNLAYKKESAVNWCPMCNTVLANEQVHNGKCWRHEKTSVQIKHLNQWYFKITDYVEELNNFDKLKDWPDLIKRLQKNWIGKSYGCEINFKINDKNWPIFTTRPDTIHGVTFMVISLQHSRLMEIVTEKEKKKVLEFLEKINSVSEEEIDKLQKEGVFTGSYAINPINSEKVPVYAGNFVLADYGSGMVMAVPAHDSRDFEFAKKYKIPIKVVIQPKDNKISYDKMTQAYTESGILINSDEFNGKNNFEAIEEIIKYLEKKKIGQKTVQYKLRDWLISRQRYWGTPIPIIYCDSCGILPVPLDDLPVKLPLDVKFGKGNPLETSEKWIKVKCPNCNKIARRETDTMDTFVNSSWYYLRYCDPNNSKKIFDEKKTNYWCPVDFYIGGKEHACMHLIYIRFYTKFLRDLKLLNFDEPSIRMFNQGIMHGEDGNKMSKSLGNVINPTDIIKKYSADSLRLFLVSVSNPSSDMIWNDNGVNSNNKFLNRVYSYFNKIKLMKINKSSKIIESKINMLIKNVSMDIEELKYNLAVIKIRKFFENLELESEVSKKDAESFLKILSVFSPHLSEELWEHIGNKDFISLSEWPKFDEKKIDMNLEKIEENFEKTISDITNILKILKEKENKEAEKIYLYVMPNEVNNYEPEKLKKRLSKEIFVFAVNDKKKYDPEEKSKKAKLGKPGIYIE